MPRRAAYPAPAPCWRLSRNGDAAAVPAPQAAGETDTGRPPNAWPGDDEKERGHAGTQPNKLEAGWEGRRGGEEGARGASARGQSPLAERWMNGTLLSSTTGERGLFCMRGTRCSSCWAWRWASRSSFRHCTSSGSLCAGQGTGQAGAPRGARAGYRVAGGSPGRQGSGVAPNFQYLCPRMAKCAGLVASSWQEVVSAQLGMASDGLEVASTQLRGWLAASRRWLAGSG